MTAMGSTGALVAAVLSSVVLFGLASLLFVVLARTRLQLHATLAFALAQVALGMMLLNNARVAVALLLFTPGLAAVGLALRRLSAAEPAAVEHNPQAQND